MIKYQLNTFIEIPHVDWCRFGNGVVAIGNIVMAPTSETSRVVNASNLEILVGTYEEFVLGYKLAENAEGVSCSFIFLLRLCVTHFPMCLVGTHAGGQLHESQPLREHSFCCQFQPFPRLWEHR